jgi:hypothetical protein
METVLTDDGWRKELGDHARQRVEAYGLDRVARAFMGVVGE